MKRHSFWALLTPAALTLILSGCPNREPAAPVELTRPRTKSVYPAPGTMAVPQEAALRFDFTEPMNLASFTDRVRLMNPAGSLLPGELTQVDSTVLFKPATPLEKATVYSAELRGGLRDTKMNTLEIAGQGAYSDTIIVASTWFFSAGDYSIGGFNSVYLRDRKEGSLRCFTALDSLTGTAVGFSAPEDAVVTPDGRFVAVANTGRNEIAFVNTGTLAIEKTLPVAANPSQVEAADGYLYAVSVNGKAVSKIELQNLTREAQFNLNFFPGKLALSTDGAALFTLDQVKRDLVILNTTSGTVIKTLSAVVDRLLLGEIRTDRHSGSLYICDAKGLKVKRTDAAGAPPETIYTFASGSEPLDITFTSQHHFVIAGKSLFKFDAVSHAALGSISFTTAPKSVSVLPTEDVLYVTLATSLVILDTQTMTILSEVPLASSGIEAVVANPVKLPN